MNLFKREPYPSSPKEWDDPKKTLYREFYLTNAVDFEILLNLVKDHMSDKGNCGVTRYRLINLLVACRSRAYYLTYQKRKYPCTWRLRWWHRLAKRYYHRRLRTRTYLNELEIFWIAQSFTRNLQKSEKTKLEYNETTRITFISQSPQTNHCDKCGSTDLTPAAWCNYCGTHTTLTGHSEFMEQIENWWKDDITGEDYEVITDLNQSDFNPENDSKEFTNTCNAIWNAKSDEEKIEIWKTITHREEYE